MGLKYPVKLEHDEEIGIVIAEIKDYPFAWSEGESEKEAIEKAFEMFVILLSDNHFENKIPRPIALPSPLESDICIELPDDVSEKVMVFNSQFTPVDWESP